MAMESEEAVTVEAGVRMAAGKTGSLLAGATALGAILAGADTATVAALDRFGAHLGLSFQAVDDILGIWGDPTVTGKPVGSDLASKKKTLPVAFAMAAAPDAAAGLQALFRNGGLDEAAVRRATAIVERAGGREATADFAARHLDAALDALVGSDLDPRASDELRLVAEFVCERER
jgi:geranylgeranyl diphosphate synthase type I